jgi:hypothetical protein
MNRKTWKRWEPTELEDFLAEYKAGESIDVLSTKYDRSPTALRQQSARMHVYRDADTLSRIRNDARLGDGSKTGPKRLEFEDG